MITTLYLSPSGSDDWNGLQSEPNDSRTDGPLGTLEGARKRVRQLRDQNMTVGVVTIRILPGLYQLPNPLSFNEQDRDILFKAESGEVVLDGSKLVEDFEEIEIKGRSCWVASVSHLIAGREIPRSLFVDGQRRPRSRYPKEGFFLIEDVPDHKGDVSIFNAAASRFKIKEGDFHPDWRNPESIEAVINHLWIEERMPVASYDAERRMLSSTHRSIFSLKNAAWMGEDPCARFYFENIFEAMSEPGEWYLDPIEERLYYLPKEGEDIGQTQIRLSQHQQLVRFHGDVDNENKVEGIHFESVTFQHSDWLPSDGWGKWWDPQTEPLTWRHKDSFNHFSRNNLEQEGLPGTPKIASVPQAAHDLPGAISFEAATNCSLRNCQFKGLGFYAVDVRGGCSHLRFQGNAFTDIGGGGIKVDGAEVSPRAKLRTHRIYIGDNTMKHLGQVFPASTGVLICHADRNVVEHNEISDLYYTAISVGWVWGYDENPTHGNVIQYNYLHDVGLGRLSDMGAIYTLGNQPGTIIRGNHIHDVAGNHYGGWGIYLDEGSAQIKVLQNIVYRTNSQSLHEHWGRSNLVSHNVFALPKSQAVTLAREEHDNSLQYPQKGALWLRNVFYTEDTAAFKDSMMYFDADLLESDLNLFWDATKKAEPVYVEYRPAPTVEAEDKDITLSMAREIGLERHSLALDPEFTDPCQGDFSVSKNSPVHQLGINLLDIAICGPRPADQRMPKVHKSFRPSGGILFAD